MSRSPALEVNLERDVRPQDGKRRRPSRRRALGLEGVLKMILGGTALAAVTPSRKTPKRPLAAVSLADLREAQRNPELHKLLLDAEAEDRQLVRDGRIHR